MPASHSPGFNVVGIPASARCTACTTCVAPCVANTCASRSREAWFASTKPHASRGYLSMPPQIGTAYVCHIIWKHNVVRHVDPELFLRRTTPIAKLLQGLDVLACDESHDIRGNIILLEDLHELWLESVVCYVFQCCGEREGGAGGRKGM